jgi:hypothetical protein
MSPAVINFISKIGARNVGEVSQRTVRPDFYVKPNGEAMESTGYRIENYPPTIEEIKSTGIRKVTVRDEGPSPTYFTTTDIRGMTAAEAQSILQVPNKPLGYIEFDTLDLLRNARIPMNDWNRGSTPEPITSFFPNFGVGGATQYLTNQPINVDKYVPFVPNKKGGK